MMMFGIFGFGILLLLLVIALPVLLVILLVTGEAGIFQRRSHPNTVQRAMQPSYTPGTHIDMVEAASLYCAHCGAGLHADWHHCPQCGAPVQ
jgi:hypothetical protein